MALPLLALIGYGAAKLGQKSSDKRAAREQEEEAVQQGQEADDLITTSGVDFTASQPAELAAFRRGLGNEDTRQATLADLQEKANQQSVRMTPGQVIEQRTKEEALRSGKIAADMAQLNFDRASGAAVDPAKYLDVVETWQARREASLAPYQVAVDSFRDLQEASKLPTGPGTVAVLFKFLQGMDGSVVRESEGKFFAASGGPLQGALNKINEIMGQGIFDATMMAQIMEVAESLVQNKITAIDEINAGYDQKLGEFSRVFGFPGLAELTQPIRSNQGVIDRRGFIPGGQTPGTAPPGAPVLPPGAPPLPDNFTPSEK